MPKKSIRKKKTSPKPSPKPCPPGQIRNPSTGRCIKSKKSKKKSKKKTVAKKSIKKTVAKKSPPKIFDFPKYIPMPKLMDEPSIITIVEPSTVSKLKQRKLNIIKPSIFSPLDDTVDDIKVSISTMSKDDTLKLKSDIDTYEADEYSVERLEKDLLDPLFLKKALEAHLASFAHKLKTYEKLMKIDWQGGKVSDDSKSMSINLNDSIKNMHSTILKEHKELKQYLTIQDKSIDLQNILYDPVNGIATIKGKSRASIRLYMIKLIYMFINRPSFFFNGFLNFMLTGPAGSGKTKIAGVLAHVLTNLGILAKNKVITATKQNLVGEFLGQSGPKTRNLLANGLESVVFIDEAYTLTPCPNDSRSGASFSEEAVGELINFIDKFVGCMAVVVAGYKGKMYDCFLTFNEGMARRFPRVIDLVNYESDDLFEIFEGFLGESIDIKSVLTKQKRSYIKKLIKLINESDMHIFTNQAGDMLNLSKTIGEDAILYDKKYNESLINLSFRKFAASKNIALNFS